MERICKHAGDYLRIALLILAAAACAAFSVPWTHHAIESLLDLHPWAHATLETSLNLVWLALAVSALAQRASAAGRRRPRAVSGLVSLAFVLFLLFPVVSASDDLAQLALINDTKGTRATADRTAEDKPATRLAAHVTMPASLPVHLGLSLPSISEFLPETLDPRGVGTPGDTTGNHSPPR